MTRRAGPAGALAAADANARMTASCADIRLAAMCSAINCSMRCPKSWSLFVFVMRPESHVPDQALKPAPERLPSNGRDKYVVAGDMLTALGVVTDKGDAGVADVVRGIVSRAEWQPAT